MDRSDKKVLRDFQQSLNTLPAQLASQVPSSSSEGELEADALEDLTPGEGSA